MERRIEERYTDGIVREAAHLYGIGRDGLRPLQASESFVYAFERGAQGCILRIGHSLRRSEAMVQGELDRIAHLAAGGIPVAEPIRSQRGNLVEAVEDGRGGDFLVTAFRAAQGRPLSDVWSPDLYTAFGRLLGRMHASAAGYEPSHASWRRPAWDDPAMDYVERFLPASERLVREKYREASAHLRTLPTDASCYGLIHFDAHGGNAMVDGAGRITLFDFDDCTYSWYANDIAIALSHLTVNAADAPALTQLFMSHLLRGYRTAYSLDRVWLKEIPVFLKMAEIFLYAVIHREAGAGPINDPRSERFMRDRKHRIEHDVPWVDFDFEALAGEL